MTIFFPDSESTILFWQVIALSIISSLGNLIFCSRKELSRKQMLIRKIIHLLYVIIAVLGGACLCGWIDPGSVWQMVIMVIFILTVYGVVMYVNMKMEIKTAEALNQKLHKLNQEEENREE